MARGQKKRIISEEEWRPVVAEYLADEAVSLSLLQRKYRIQSRLIRIKLVSLGIYRGANLSKAIISAAKREKSGRFAKMDFFKEPR